MLQANKIYNTDCVQGLKQLDAGSIDAVITSPPYNQNLTTQDTSRQLYDDNKEEKEYIRWLAEIFILIRNILKPKGSFFYNYKTQVDGNILKQASENLRLVNADARFKVAAEIVWKFAGNFDSARTRFPTDYEMFYHLVKNPDYKFFDLGRKLTSVWKIKHVMNGTPERNDCGSHPCPFPVEIVRRIIEHTTEKGDLVLDPFAGSFTVAVACQQMQRKFIGFEISKDYCEIGKRRLMQKSLLSLMDVCEKRDENIDYDEPEMIEVKVHDDGW